MECRPPTTHMGIAAAIATFVVAALPAGAIAQSAGAGPAIARAARTSLPMVIDGKDDEAVWRTIPATSGFRQYYPREDGKPTVETEFKVAYDDRNLYVYVRAFDPHPDSIMRALARRDVNTASDGIGITIDAYHDRRTGVEFAINPDGVKRDCAVYADTLFDWSWDGVWDAATRIDSLGWTAEFQIPFSQIRYADTPRHTFGFAVWRGSYRYYESSIWPLWRTSRGGLMSQLGDLTGIDDIASPHALAVTPYTVASNSPRRSATGYGRAQLASVGGDVKYGISPNISLDATVRPDFGQVEADPSVLNLTTAETFYPEKRPFFLEGSKLYQFDLGCNSASCAGEGLFYSRRIGRAPQLLGAFGDATSPQATPIAAAMKLTGRTDGGLTVAALDAATQRVGGVASRTIEPQTNYAVVRAIQELASGRTAIGLMATGVDRALDASTSSVLRRDGYTASVDMRQRFGDSPFGASASLTGSRVDGSARSIAATESSPAHNYLRRDGSLRFDSTRTSLTGDAEELTIGKYSGVVQFLTQWQRHSAGLEVNDVGYMQRSDLQSLTSGATMKITTPHWIYRQLQLYLNWSKMWNTDWMQIAHGASAEMFTLLASNWSIDAKVNLSQFPGTMCDQCARGGPAVRRDLSASPALTINGDPRRFVVPSLSVNTLHTDGGRTHSFSLQPGMTLNLSTRAQFSLGGAYTRNHDDTQWYGNFSDSMHTTHYTFALLDQRTLALTTRASFAAAPTMTVELYASPFVSTGTYANVRELSAAPRSVSYDARFMAFTPPASSAPGFDVRQLRSNLVGRWEYRPGSTLFVVWTHGRNANDPTSAKHPWSDEYRSLFALHPDNTFVVKAAYWLSR